MRKKNVLLIGKIVSITKDKKLKSTCGICFNSRKDVFMLIGERAALLFTMAQLSVSCDLSSMTFLISQLGRKIETVKIRVMFDAL